MRRFWIQQVLPILLCLVPVLAAGLVVVALPPLALQFYLEQVRRSPIDWLILGLGLALFVVQLGLSQRALQWTGTGFDERPDRWLSHLAQAAEWFPLLGLLGTVAGILQTFGSITGPITPQEVIAKYSPAITATGSGLLMALLNILPTWLVLIGRDVIRPLGGDTEGRR
ncbi:MAG: MotA/TolQ/ExbB proton channel family protein [Gemmataceae bacterium]|nr:MotA/TolQ/ExbB proton channel family protein [Gemmataceae bacterium]MDW8267328.1 MotA/TolQ/ExbB proton channel family protein [Gemmataceae bacterium]